MNKLEGNAMISDTKPSVRLLFLMNFCAEMISAFALIENETLYFTGGNE